ncbi:hypothetical protein R1flu_020392 [Riccia fluitans]|uniref:Uncharacterized protein n=1 Tax=Riccia fluitans TaxID=41844 RepID=A0ABD1ZQ53_9MARC
MLSSPVVVKQLSVCFWSIPELRISVMINVPRSRFLQIRPCESSHHRGAWALENPSCVGSNLYVLLSGLNLLETPVREGNEYRNLYYRPVTKLHSPE